MAEQRLNSGVRRRRSAAEGARLVREFERSGLGRKEFCGAHGLSVHTLDAWRRRIALSASGEEIVPVEIIAERAGVGPRESGVTERRGRFRILLGDGLGIEVEPGFDAAELRRLIAALDNVPAQELLRRAV